jgi:hypothetical protein
MKIKKSSIFALICSLLIVSCNGSTKPKDAQVGDEMSILNGVEFDYDNAFFDDFSNGVNNESWFNIIRLCKKLSRFRNDSIVFRSQRI